MKKLTLKVETLRVDSFETEAGSAERGTVHANSFISFYCGGYTLVAISCTSCLPTDGATDDPPT